MPETDTATAEPEISQTLKNFGDLGEIFDKVFPSTAEPKEPVATAPPPAAPPAPPEPPKSEEPPKPAEPPPPAPEPVSDELPDFLTGKKTELAPPKDDIPPPAANEPKDVVKLREAYNRVRQEIEGKDAQIAELKKAPARAPEAEAEIQRLTGQVQQLSSALERLGVENHPGFIETFKQPIERKRHLGRKILEGAGADPRQWDRAYALTGASREAALQDLYEQLPSSARGRMDKLDVDIMELEEQRDAYLADNKNVTERLQQEEMVRQREKMREHERTSLAMLDEASRYVVDNLGIEVFKKSDDPKHAKWNESVDRMNEDARKLYLETTDPKVFAIACKLAPAALQLQYLYHVMRDRWLDSERQLKEIRDSEPKLETHGEVSPTGGEDDKLTFAQAAARAWPVGK